MPPPPLASSLYSGAECEFIIQKKREFGDFALFWCRKWVYNSRPNFFIVADRQMWFGTNYKDTLNLLYLDLLRFSDKFGKRSSGSNFDIRLGLLF